MGRAPDGLLRSAVAVEPTPLVTRRLDRAGNVQWAILAVITALCPDPLPQLGGQSRPSTLGAVWFRYRRYRRYSRYKSSFLHLRYGLQRASPYLHWFYLPTHFL